MTTEIPIASRTVLSLRENEVWALLAKGMTNKEISEALGLAEKTVKAYVSGLFSVLKVKNCRQAIVKFYTLPIVERPLVHVAKDTNVPNAYTLPHGEDSL